MIVALIGCSIGILRSLHRTCSADAHKSVILLTINHGSEREHGNETTIFLKFINRSLALKIQDIFPVLASMVIIILVAIIERQSRFAAAITAVMPIGATLALWIVYAANNGDRHIMTDFSQGLLLGILPTIGFLIVAWLAARAGLKLFPMLMAGYGVWGIGVGLMFLVKKLMGI